jgi:type IV fimbrial biogenesis protein FimT
MRQRGITLVEMMVTVAVIALVAVIAMPTAGPTRSFAADAAAGEVVRAIRFAQREAIRTSAWHAVRFDLPSQSLQVYRITSAGLQDNANLVFHPVDKARYTIRFGDMPGAIGQLATVEFKYRTRPVTNFISFRPDGAPASINPADQGVDTLEQDGKVVIVQGTVQRTVAVARVTGRVTF